MTREEEKVYATQRIDSLLDDKIKDLRDDIGVVGASVIRLEKILVGNGSEGVLQIQAKNCAKIKILMWLSSVIVGAIIGAYIKTAKIDLSELDVKQATELAKMLSEQAAEGN